MKVKTSILLLLMIATALPSFGGNGNGNGTDSLQATRYVTRATMYGVGYTNVFDNLPFSAGIQGNRVPHQP